MIFLITHQTLSLFFLGISMAIPTTSDGHGAMAILAIRNPPRSLLFHRMWTTVTKVSGGAVVID
jgi:hypothetical protein